MQWCGCRCSSDDGHAAQQALEAGGARRLRNESFFGAPQLKRDPLGIPTSAVMNSESINPWGEFRKRFGACQKVMALGLFSCLMLFSPTLYNAWTVIAVVLSSLLIFFAVRV